ncbi:16S rRNA (guanine(527)-N(7))-methyltransferase RsmG [Parapusillimonas granuli]|uniref:Ribosomal RNA small subunit methyltransferase G n=1 Tax=Parapusillimonas granuli TaxID=380911 RepID=A0A853FYZ3_9BURK|nr:16S rRNA (guanine(527)-N(7))-methyltransferase RsmG [Parapusillimonas granuli]MBB5216363.1 16S rRNA (guanine527-N7)-methyltransferase [Parapusillimonas granuli]NYT48040.1 16S rRNA (guanine(527)-N(7))-methyltransferase RsmG [Parapusillimonas granuli]
MTTTNSFQDRLQAAAASLHIGLDEAKGAALLKYLEQLQRWNKTYNLTALRDPDKMLVQHVFDSLAILPEVEQELYKNTVKEPLIVDVGSGAGLPGVVLAIMHPEWRVRCVDAVEKKMAFVRQAAGVLGLGNLKAMHGRIETLPPFEADLVVSRAFASLLDFATLAGHHVASAGHLLAMKGQKPDDEIEALHSNTEWRVERLAPLSVPELDARRCLIWMSREGTP